MVQFFKYNYTQLKVPCYRILQNESLKSFMHSVNYHWKHKSASDSLDIIFVFVHIQDLDYLFLKYCMYTALRICSLESW